MSSPMLAPGDRLCFVADGRSPIARNWIAYFVARGFAVHLVSTFPCDTAGLGLASIHVVPVAFARLAGTGASRPTTPTRDALAAPPRPALVRRWRGRLSGAALPVVLGWLAPLTLSRYVGRLHAIVRDIDPVLVHAMRVPYEGVLAALALEHDARPLVVSIWGNDLELWAGHYPLVARLTRRVLRRTTALLGDCARDLRLASTWGWDARRPSAVIPGNGGVRSDQFHPGPPDTAALARFDIPAEAPLVLNARGFRGYVRNDTFFRAIPFVLAQRPDVVFAGVGMQGHPAALRWVRTLGIERSVRLLPPVQPADIAALFRAATVAVSPAEYDGTPNTLLEAMACGALPVAGDIESVREWIEDGRNGLLVDPANPRALADALLRALDDEALRERAAVRNRTLVAERADYDRGMQEVETFYAATVERVRVPSGAGPVRDRTGLARRSAAMAR